MRGLRAVALLVAGCGIGDGPLDEIDPAAAPAEPTWSAHVRPIIDWRCSTCHSAEAQPGRQDGVGYDSCEELRRGWDDLAETAIDGASMPPGGAERLTSSEVLTLQRWWANGGPRDRGPRPRRR